MIHVLLQKGSPGSGFRKVAKAALWGALLAACATVVLHYAIMIGATLNPELGMLYGLLYIALMSPSAYLYKFCGHSWIVGEAGDITWRVVSIITCVNSAIGCVLGGGFGSALLSFRWLR